MVTNPEKKPKPEKPKVTPLEQARTEVMAAGEWTREDLGKSYDEIMDYVTKAKGKGDHYAQMRYLVSELPKDRKPGDEDVFTAEVAIGILVRERELENNTGPRKIKDIYEYVDDSVGDVLEGIEKGKEAAKKAAAKKKPEKPAVEDDKPLAAAAVPAAPATVTVKVTDNPIDASYRELVAAGLVKDTPALRATVNASRVAFGKLNTYHANMGQLWNDWQKDPATGVVKNPAAGDAILVLGNAALIESSQIDATKKNEATVTYNAWTAKDRPKMKQFYNIAFKEAQAAKGPAASAETTTTTTEQTTPPTTAPATPAAGNQDAEDANKALTDDAEHGLLDLADDEFTGKTKSGEEKKFHGRLFVGSQLINPDQFVAATFDLQQSLNRVTEGGLSRFGIDGKFGNETKAAVEKIQAEFGLKVDGVAGTQTITALQIKEASVLLGTLAADGLSAADKKEINAELQDIVTMAKLDGALGGNAKEKVAQLLETLKVTGKIADVDSDPQLKDVIKSLRQVTGIAK